MERILSGTVFTIGHSTHTQERFIDLLQNNKVTAVADVRSMPYSRTNPQFNRKELNQALRIKGIAYVFLGKELGARSEDPTCYVDGKVHYGRLAQTEGFKHGLKRVMTGMYKHRVALMCAEKEPLNCHRTILVARNLVLAGVNVLHILPDYVLETHADTMNRLLHQLGIQEGHMFRSLEQLWAEAYERQEERIAYTITTTSNPDSEHAVTF